MRFWTWTLIVIVAVASLFITSTASAQRRYIQPDGNNANPSDDWGPINTWQTLNYALDVLNSAKKDPPFTEI